VPVSVSPYSITSSARSSGDGGKGETERPGGTKRRAGPPKTVASFMSVANRTMSSPRIWAI